MKQAFIAGVILWIFVPLFSLAIGLQASGIIWSIAQTITELSYFMATVFDVPFGYMNGYQRAMTLLWSSALWGTICMIVYGMISLCKK